MSENRTEPDATCVHCDQPIWLADNGDWKHNEHGAWFNRCQRVANYGTDATPKPSEESL